MKQLKFEPSYFLRGTVMVDPMGKSHKDSGLSLVTDHQREYRIRPGKLAEKLADCAWDEVEIEFHFVDGLRGGPWIDVMNYRLLEVQTQRPDMENIDGETDWEEANTTGGLDVDAMIDRYGTLQDFSLHDETPVPAGVNRTRFARGQRDPPKAA